MIGHFWNGVMRGVLLGVVIAIIDRSAFAFGRRFEANPVAQALYFGAVMMGSGIIIGWHAHKEFGASHGQRKK